MDEYRPIDLSDSQRMRKYWKRRAELEYIDKTGKLSPSEVIELNALRRDLSERHGVPPYEE